MRQAVGDDRGFTSVEFIVAAALSLVFTAGLLDVAVVQYSRGAIHSALEAGTRAGARLGAGTGECTVAADAWLGDVLGGTRGDTVVVACQADATTIRASATAVWEAWLPGVPAWQVNVESVRTREVIP